ncbi:MAG: ABC transporter permease, partial [Myxococcota bacterium]
MLRNYLTVAYRNLTKSPLYTGINVVGLGIGLAACVLILLYVRGEFSFENWVPDGERIHRVHARFDVPGRAPIMATSSPGPVREKLLEAFPEIEAAARIHPRRSKVQLEDKLFYERFYLVDDTWFDLFPPNFIEGEMKSALRDTSSVVLSQSMKEKYFGEGSALGKTISLDDSVRDREFKVTGVIEDSPKNSEFTWEFLGLFDPEEFKEQPWIAEQWTSVNVETFIKLKPGADAAALATKLPEFEKQYIPNVQMGGKTLPVHEFIEFTIMPLPDLHLHSVEGSQVNAVTPYTSVMTFAGVALLILIIACINFMNLSTARASQRAREVSLRKVVGATRRELVMQFLGESSMLALLGLVFAMAIAQLALPAYNQFLDRELTLSFFGADSLLPWLLALVLLVGVGGGLYPAFYLSRFRPASVLKANKSSETQGSARLRNALVILQFAVSIALIICATIVYQQYNYTQSKDLGFHKENMIVVRDMFRDAAKKASDVLAEEIRRIPGVEATTLSGAVPGDGQENNGLLEVPGDTRGEPLVLGRFDMDWNFFEAYGIDLLAGRYLSEDFANDDMTGLSDLAKEDPEAVADRQVSIMVNREGVRMLGFSTPDEAIGKLMKLTVTENIRVDAQIVGVLDSFHYKSIHEQIRPTYYIHDGTNSAMTIRVAKGVDLDAVMKSAESVWRQHVPELPFRGQILEENLSELYEAEEARAQMFTVFSLLAVIIACLGLYGLASFTAARRTKEIGIRKVMGASTLDIVRLLLWQFSKPVLIANLIAWPASAYMMNDWLTSFQYRVSLNPLLFVAAGILALLIAWVTVGGHAARFAQTRP